MPINVLWDDAEQTIVRADFTPGWSFADFRDATDTIHRMAKEEFNPSFRGVIIDLTKEMMPPIGALPHFKASIMGGGDQPRPVIFVNSDGVTQRLFQTACVIYRIKRPLYFVKTLQEARNILMEQAVASFAE